ncbi:TetR/AcrR family transcriptional regulator [Pseudonocardia acaciae]|uniref:TetR/AcrR family transcriptional regulator n=1 Tax=Pseudonocardia acaciae TaxID=551276 RepID=UPI0006844080|nr:TetR/AcrR family transcriptional regulator [Pseudonocardia acaciae]
MTCDDADTGGLGLRERKKRATRRAILDAAHALFAERGYDNVTVTEIARAVRLSAKTVFVYFPSKLDLVFDHEDEVRAMLQERIRDRPPGRTPLDAMAATVREWISGSCAVADLDRLHRMVADSETLRSRMRLMWERLEQALAEVLAEESGEDRHAPGPRVVAAQLLLLFRLMSSEHLLGYLRARAEPERRAAMADWLDGCLELIGDGIADYARRPATGVKVSADGAVREDRHSGGNQNHNTERKPG